MTKAIASILKRVQTVGQTDLVRVDPVDIVTKGLAYTKRTFRYSSNKGARGLTRHPIRDYSQDRGGAQS